MFTGIVEELGEVVGISPQGGNTDLVLRARMATELRVDQSVSHNGVCLTVVAVQPAVGAALGTYRVTAVHETLMRSNLGDLKPGAWVNLERGLRIGDRLDGHMVQGHVDTVVECLSVSEQDGSWVYGFSVPDQRHLLVEKGSICLDGVSLTIASLTAEAFTVAVIPYTYGHTTFRSIVPGASVNVEFDVIGKYVARMVGERAIP